MNDYLYGREYSPNEKVIQLERVEAVERERDQFRDQLDAWQRSFATSQLSHALARLEAAESTVKRLTEREAHFASVLGVCDGGRYRNDWDAPIRKVLEENARLKGDKLPHRQDSLVDQLLDLVPLATKAGCYDAADYIRRIVEDIDKKVAGIA